MERTFVIIKPDGVQRGLIGEIVGRFEKRGLKIAAMRFLQVSDELARKHYAVHEGKPFYAGLIEYIVSGPVVALVLEGTSSITVVRKMLGATKPAEAELGSDFSLPLFHDAVLLQGAVPLNQLERQVDKFIAERAK